MGWTEIVVAAVAGAALVVLFTRFARSRQRVMAYHEIPTPHVHHATHGSGHGL